MRSYGDTNQFNKQLRTHFGQPGAPSLSRHRVQCYSRLAQCGRSCFFQFHTRHSFGTNWELQSRTCLAPDCVGEIRVVVRLPPLRRGSPSGHSVPSQRGSEDSNMQTPLLSGHWP